MDFLATLALCLVAWTVGTVQTAWALRAKQQPMQSAPLLRLVHERPATVDERIREGRA